MKTQTLHLANALGEQSSFALASLLLRILGVDAVACHPGVARVSVDFDEDRTSGLEIETAIARAGYALTPGAQGERQTTCCGGCGGAGH